MKARVKATGEIVEVYPSIHKGCDYDGSDGYSYVKEDIIILDDEPDYWTRLEHQYVGMAMQGILSNKNLVADISRYDIGLAEGVAKVSKEMAIALVKRFKSK